MYKFYYISGFIILPPITKVKGWQKRQICKSQNFDFVFTNLLKNGAEIMIVALEEKFLMFVKYYERLHYKH